MEGIWKVEMWGPYGWSVVATALFREGEYLDASERHYSRGTYETDGDGVSIEATTHVHTGDEHLFGRVDKVFNTHIKGEVNGPTITGELTDTAMKYALPLRMIKVG